MVALTDGGTTGLQRPDAVRRLSRRRRRRPTAVLLRNNGLHIEIVIDRAHPIGEDDPAGIADVVLEAALTTIMDCEDSVAAVDAEDKVAGLPQLARPDEGRRSTRELRQGRQARSSARSTPTASTRRRTAATLTLHGPLPDAGAQCRPPDDQPTPSSTRDGDEIPEGILDAVVTALIALHDLKGASGRSRNSRAGSVYIVKPKMHGPDEVAFADELFAASRTLLGLPRHTHQDRHHGRGAAHHASTSRPASARRSDRVVFINTGFLDRTGDEIHTSMRSRPDDPQGRHEGTRLDQGLRGLERRHRPRLRPARPGADRQGHVGDARPDGRHAGAEDRAIRKAGANTAWVPSPTAATLHALHYHQVDVFARQAELPARAARQARRHPDRSRSPHGRTGRRTRSSRSSTTTRRASSATSCAGSTRASAARRCPTSTTSA